MTYRVGVDIGGTFTDFSVLDESTGRLVAYKTPTIPSDPAGCVAKGLQELLSRERIAPSAIGYFVHGTTIGLNTVIQRAGASLALLVTEGFGDILQIQRLRLRDPVNFNASQPIPLIPRAQVFEVRERVLADGSVDIPLDEGSVREGLRRAASFGVDGVVICLINAYRNHEHELAVLRIAADAMPDTYVCCSHQVWPQFREYERAIVAILNAYIRPKLAGYLDTLADRLAALGVPAQPHITKSNGGLLTARSARDLPVVTLLSGPASGVIGASYIAGLSGYRDLLTFDMGGTSADIAVVRDGQAAYSRDEHIGDFPLVMPAVGVSSIGAGGGSIAWFDRSGFLKVGPRSAGAEPGPVCYGRGGTEPTLTDAFLMCGFLNKENFLGGRVRLDADGAHRSLEAIAERLSLSADEAAEAVVEVATANMYAEFSQVMARYGLDPREFTLVAFGGAGPIQACFLAAEFRIPRVLVPLSPGTLCALGALSADATNDYVRTVNLKLDEADPQRLRALFDELTDQAMGWLRSEGFRNEGQELRYSADLRYRHQAWEIELPIKNTWLESGGLDLWAQAFHTQHERMFGHADKRHPVELIGLNVKVIGTTPKPPATRLPQQRGDLRPASHRPIHYRGQRHTAAVYLRAELQAGHVVKGPAIIEQDDTTVLLPAACVGNVDEYGNLLITFDSEVALPVRSSHAPAVNELMH